MAKLLKKLRKFLMKERFKLPKWVKPELNTLMYWVHLIIIAAVVLGLLQLFFGGSMFLIKNIFLSVPFLAVGDFLAHSLLKLD